MTGEPFGTLSDGRTVERYTLTRPGGISAGILTYGGIIDALEMPDATGERANVVLGYSDLAGYVHGANTYFGALIGRYGNRIARGAFRLDGVRYSLAINNPPNALHGGLTGFDKAVWAVESATPSALTLHHRSPDGDGGYPGALDVRVTYALEDGDRLRITYVATTDAPTIVNLTNHTYFNLAGEASGDVFGHELTLNASRYTPVDATMIPTGELAPVDGTPFDFRTPHAIGARLRDNDPQLLIAQGYDHNYVLDGYTGDSLVRAALATDPGSGRSVEISTTEPGVQFYSGNFLNGSELGRGARVYRQSAGFALETQHFPDSPNQQAFPTTVVRPGQTYRSETVWRFFARPRLA